MTGRRARARIGCSGWQYPHWRGVFYPRDLPQRFWLEHYAGVFDTVEINNTFYRLPEAARFAAWRAASPKRFLFAVKMSRYLTHMKKLTDPREPLERFFSRAESLGRKLGPVLYQLPPRWKCDLARLEQLLARLPRGRHAFEFRDPTWYREDVFAALTRAKATLCLHDMRSSESPRRAIGRFIYVRFHGIGRRHAGTYSDEELDEWAKWLRLQLAEGRDV
jgi:uncharacterized protein YecE (DUF72 family)